VEPTQADLKKRYDACNRIVQESLPAIKKVLPALRRIRDEKTYLASGHETFEEYLQLRWGFNSALIEFIKVGLEKEIA
jgi:hypothetical protein